MSRPSNRSAASPTKFFILFTSFLHCGYRSCFVRSHVPARRHQRQRLTQSLVHRLPSWPTVAYSGRGSPAAAFSGWPARYPVNTSRTWPARSATTARCASVNPLSTIVGDSSPTASRLSDGRAPATNLPICTARTCVVRPPRSTTRAASSSTTSYGSPS